MEQPDKNNELFVRWLNDDLSAEELRDFQQSPKFSLYQRIANKSSELDTPAFNEDNVFNRIQQELETPISKVKNLNTRIIFSIAASIVLLLGFYFYTNRTITYDTGFGEQLTIQLPDHSEVILNTNSTLSFKNQNWEDHRSLHLTGEAYFKVSKGAQFKVNTDLGTVTVLGTQFNVNTKNKLFEVQCFEGKVSVQTTSNNRILTKGKGFRVYNNNVEDVQSTANLPSWTKGESSFSNIPLSLVITSLEDQYGVTINASNIDISQKFTGSFTHNNLNIALQTVFVPLKINFKQVDTKTIVLKSNK